ncbi:hypothetical protein FF38_12035 [Lucilia cuprina]|uniref:Uncharacterized protein n=1 Tax=Lucilia cuprina TaxID=7375 RepID=A0A0L0BM30_LUCCU|nr:hypothetical protein FF38_12035 [Lucilia cuprina]
MDLKALWVQYTTPITLVCKTCSMSARFPVHSWPFFMQPALFTKISTPPNFEIILSNVSLTDFKLETSHLRAVNFDCNLTGNCFLSSSTRSTRRARPTTCKPLLMRSLTMAEPIPELAPANLIVHETSKNVIFGYVESYIHSINHIFNSGIVSNEHEAQIRLRRAESESGLIKLQDTISQIPDVMESELKFRFNVSVFRLFSMLSALLFKYLFVSEREYISMIYRSETIDPYRFKSKYGI